MLHWYYKTTYNLGQIFSLKRHTIWDGESIIYKFVKVIYKKTTYENTIFVSKIL